MKILHFDLETTGTLFWRHGIHQLAGIVEIDGKEVEEFDFKMQPNPACQIDEEALKVAHITREDLNTYPLMGLQYVAFTAMLAKYVNKFDKKDKFFLCGYNTQAFDSPFLRAWFKQNDDEYFGSWFWSVTLDVMILAQKMLMKDRHIMKDFSLTTVCKHAGIEVDETRTHDALYDVILSKKLFEFICKYFG